MSQTIRIGIAGLRRGMVYAKLIGALARSGTQVAVGAVFDPRDDRAELAQREVGDVRVCGSYAELLEADIDAVIIASPPPYHAEQTIAAGQAGHAVLCEVPSVLSVDEAQRVVDAVVGNDVKYMLASNGNYVGFIRSWEAMTRRGDLGTVMYAEAEYIHDLRDWMLQDEAGARVPYGERDRFPETVTTWRAGFPPMHYIPHCMGPLLAILDDRCASVSALGTAPVMAPDIRSVSDMEVGIFRTVGGAILRCTLGYAVAREPAIVGWYSLYGTRGAVEWRRSNSDSPKAWFEGWPNVTDSLRVPWSTLNSDAPAEASSWDDFGRPQKSREWDCDWFVVRDFVDLVAGVLPESPIDVFRALDYTLPGVCAHESALAGGEPVDVPDPRLFR